MRKLLNKIFLFAFLFFVNNAQAQITVAQNANANQLAQMLVGKGVKVSNAVLTGSVGQAGKFYTKNGALPFDSGIVLSTGYVKSNGSNVGVDGAQSNFASKSFNGAGHADLEWLLNNTGAPKTHDACVLEFDFVPDGDSISVGYIFSSEEYTSYVCTQFNDVFGFFLTGFGIIGRKNLALVPNNIPNNNIPVSINSVNNGIPGTSGGIITTCQATGIGAPYTAFYQSNASGSYLTHYGRTTELVARAKVTRCKTYHLRLAIADFSDEIWDSGIFLKASSLISSPPASLNIAGAYRDSSKDVLVERCHPKGYVKLYRNTKLDTTTALTLNFSYGGTATYGVDYTAPTSLTFGAYKTVDSLPIDVIDDGVGDDNETIIIKMNASCAGVADSIPLKIKEFWGYTQNIDTTICYKNGSKLSSLYSDSLQTTFLWSTGATTGSIFPDSSGLYTVEALLKNSCFLKDTFKVKVDSFIVSNTVKNYSTCSLDSVTLSYISNQKALTHLWSTGSTDSIIKVNVTGNYIMNATSANGCKSSDTSFIKYISIPILSLPSTADFCSGDSVLLTASNDLGLKYKWNTGDSSNAIWVKNSGTYSVVAQANGCIVYDTTIVTSKPNPSVNLPANISKCKGETVWLNASTLAGSIYTWSNGNNTDSIAVTTTDRYIVNVNLNGCFATDTSDVIFYDIPVVNLSAIVNFCAGDSVVLNALTFAGTSYLWSTGDTTSSIVVKANGTYTIKATLGVCSAYDTTIVNVTQYPTLNLQTNISSCKGDSVLLDATNVTGTIYTWSTGETTPTIWIKNSGTYYVDASINGCGAKDTSVAIFNNTPVLNLPTTKNICAGDSALLNATTYTGTHYLWSTGDTTATIYVKANGSYSVKASLGVCDAYDTTVINVTQYPTLNLQTNISSCKGDSILLDATNAAGTIYTWSNGATTPTLWIKNSGTYIVKADINSCVTRDTSVTIFNNTPILNLPAVKNICEGDSAVLNATTYFGTSYFWNTGAITPTLKVKTSGTYFVKASLGVCDAYDTTIVSVTQYQQLSLPANISACQGDTFLLDATAAAGTVYIWSNGATTPTITINNSGTYVVNASLNGCSTRDTTEAIFNYTPVLNLPSTVNFCEGDSILLNATSYPGTSYLWNIGAITPTLNVKQSGIYSVKASLGVCNATDSTIVNVTQYQVLNLPPTVVGCAGDSVFLDATSAPGTLYTWSNGATTPTLWVKADGSYRVMASLNGCPTRDTSTIVFNIPPTVTVQPSFASFCDGDSVLLTATSNMTNSKFLWNTNDATNTLLVKVSGEFLVDVKANGCTTRGVANVIAYPIPTVDVGKDLYIMQGDKEIIKATASNDVNTFTWTPSIGLDNATILQPEIINPTETKYKLTVSNGYCSNFDTVRVIVLGSFKIPNVFSPNGDGVNDFWEIKGMEKYKTVDVSVFDRYGRKVYETSGYSTAWDGTHKGTGKPLPVGVYYYIIDAKRGIPPFIGSVTILR